MCMHTSLLYNETTCPDHLVNNKGKKTAKLSLTQLTLIGLKLAQKFPRNSKNR